MIICADSGQLAGEGCPYERQVERVFRIVPEGSGPSSDTRYALPQDFLNNNVCHLHSGGYYPEGEDLWWAGTYDIPSPEDPGEGQDAWQPEQEMPWQE